MAVPNTTTPDARDEAQGRAGIESRLWLHFFERKLLLAFMDSAVINLTLFTILTLRPFPFYRGFDPAFSRNFISQLTDRWSWFVILSVVWLICAFMFDCYNLTSAANVLHSLGRLSGAIFLTSSIYLLIPRVTPALPVSRLDIFLFPFLGLIGIVAWRTVYATVLVHPNFRQRALVVGAGLAGCTLVQAINQMSLGKGVAAQNIGYQILGFVDDDVAKQGTMIENVPVVGTRHELVQLAQRLRPNEIVVAITHAETMHAELFDAILACHEMGMSITTMATFYERLTGRVPIEHAGRALSVTLPLGRPVTHRFYLVLKRLLDIAVGLLGCLLLLLLIPFVWLGNRVSSPGPLFYSQMRVGKGGYPFSIVKFRSMSVDAEKHTGAVWAVENDLRITPVGHVLRRTRLDEFPQFWSVLIGGMSVIGPRPERPYFVDQLTRQIPFYRVRHAVKPGLTGWSQVMYRYGASVEDALTKLQYDLYYIKHQSVLLDLHILLKTVPIVIGLKGR